MEQLSPRYAIQSDEGEIYVAGLAWLSWIEEVRSGTSNLFYINKYDLEELPISVAEITAESSILLWPNPARDILTVENPKPIKAIQITSLDGKLVYRSENLQTLKTTINVSHLAPQLYAVSVQTENGIVSVQTENGIETVRFAKN